MKVKTATWLIAWYMRLCGFAGWASFWFTIYVLPGFEHDQRLLRHERKHLEQIESDGRLVFGIKYLYWLAKSGYNGDHPYEVEARKAENG